MRNLKRGLVLLAILCALSATLAFSDAGSTAAASLRLAAAQASSVDLQISIDPPILEPGQQGIVTVTLQNLSPGPIAPEVLILLPPSVATRLNELPAGTIYNAQSGTLNWQPVMSANGSALQLALPVVAKVADPLAPEQTLEVVVQANGAETRQQATLWVGLAPSASIRVSPPQVAVGQPVQLFGEVTGPGPVDQLWSLGDGRIVEADNPSVVYPYSGDYEVVFQASTPMGVFSQRMVVSVTAQTIAKFGVSDNTPAVGAPVVFSNESGGEPPLSYLWDFGDGSIAEDAQPSHAYQAPGMYDVRLYVTGANGQSEAVHTILVGDAPVADFVIGESVDAGAVIQGQAFTDESAISVLWDMGDGRTYEGATVEHVYWAAADYPVTLTVTNEYGEARIMRMVRVNPGPVYLYLPLVFSPSIPEEPPGPPTETPEEQQAPVAVEETPEELAALDLPADLSPQEALLAYINEARRLNGLSALNQVAELSAAAQSHADDMASNGLTSHTGSDGTVPANRIMLSGYPGGYAGEATAWGMAQAIEPVRFWLASPGHRTIILDPAAKDVGVGFGENYESPSVWYWTAEFASLDLPVVEVPLPTAIVPPPEPVVTLLGPPTDGEFLMNPETTLIFTWSWPVPLSAEQRFGVYLNSRGRTIQLGTVRTPESEDQYQFSTSASNVPAIPGQQSWFVRLENTPSGTMLEQTEPRPIVFLSEP